LLGIALHCAPETFFLFFPGTPQHSCFVVLFPRIEDPPTPPFHGTVKLRVPFSVLVADVFGRENIVPFNIWIGWLPSHRKRHSHCPVQYGNPGSLADQCWFQPFSLLITPFMLAEFPPRYSHDKPNSPVRSLSLEVLDDLISVVRLAAHPGSKLVFAYPRTQYGCLNHQRPHFYPILRLFMPPPLLGKSS
jgi:hypothetical protein